MASTIKITCLCLPGGGIKGMCHCAWPLKSFFFFFKCIARLFWLIFVIAHEKMDNDFCHCVCYFKIFIY